MIRIPLFPSDSSTKVIGRRSRIYPIRKRLNQVFLAIVVYYYWCYYYFFDSFYCSPSPSSGVVEAFSSSFQNIARHSYSFRTSSNTNRLTTTSGDDVSCRKMALSCAADSSSKMTPDDATTDTITTQHNAKESISLQSPIITENQERETRNYDVDESTKAEEDPLLTKLPCNLLTTTLKSQNDYNDDDSSSALETSSVLPTKLAYPFWYEPHPIAKWAANQLKQELPSYDPKEDYDKSTSTTNSVALGKMYGVLVVDIDDFDSSSSENNTTVESNNQQHLSSSRRLGYLKAYSGTMPRPQYGGKKLSDETITRDTTAGFCPSVYDRFTNEPKNDDFNYEREEEILNGYTREIERLESCHELTENEQRWKAEEAKLQSQLDYAKKEQKIKKCDRKECRTKYRNELIANLSGEENDTIDSIRSMSDKESHKYFLEHSEEYWQLEDQLIQEASFYQREFKTLKAKVEAELCQIQKSLNERQTQIETLKQRRKDGSNKLQQKLFERYRLRNKFGNIQTPVEIFQDTPLRVPPSGAGDCAAIKLFQYAFAQGYHPIALAEFWWGPSPHNTICSADSATASASSDVARTHGNYYPCCRGKCEPILTRHMLLGMDVQSDPLTEGFLLSSSKNQKAEIPLSIVYEDEWLVVVNKPHDVLSVPGRTVRASIETELLKRYPKAKRPILVHRLDYSTSGLILGAKDEATHKMLQSQFIDRTVKKRYTALLDGELASEKNNDKNKGTIDLPLAGDYLNRPMQKVERGPEGKPAVTHYEILRDSKEVSQNDDLKDQTYRNHGKRKRKRTTRVHFYPVTGRTHQLRVHASHPDGLGVAIVGDDIYGQRSDRLCLHAGFLQIHHPHTGKRMTFEAPVPF